MTMVVMMLMITSTLPIPFRPMLNHILIEYLLLVHVTRQRQVEKAWDSKVEKRQRDGLREREEAQHRLTLLTH